MRRPPVNLTRAERVARIVVGLAAIAVSAVLLAATSGALATALELLLLAAGLDLVVTGLLGHCPLYRRLGHVPRALRRVPGGADR